MASWLNPHAGAHADGKVCLGVESIASRQDLLIKVVAKVNDRVNEITSTAIANPTCLMIVATLGCASTPVAHVLLTTTGAVFEVDVSVNFGHVLWDDSTLAMESIHILTYDSLQDSSALQFNQSHMSE